MNLDEIASKHQTWVKRNFPTALPHQPLLGVAEEVGELCHAHLKLEQGIRGTPEEHYAAKADAVGDICMYLLHYCLLNNLSFQICMQTAWLEIEKRDWQKNKQTGLAD